MIISLIISANVRDKSRQVPVSSDLSNKSTGFSVLIKIEKKIII